MLCLMRRPLGQNCVTCRTHTCVGVMLWLLTLFHCLPGVREHVLSPVTWLGVLALHSVGKATGMAVDCGDGATQVVPIWQGKSMMHAVQRIDLAGRELNEYMYGSLVFLTS